MEFWAVVAIVAAVAVGAIVVVSIVSGRWRTPDKAGDSLLTLGITLEVIGIVFGSDRLIGYPLIGAGVVLSLLSLYRRKHRAG